MSENKLESKPLSGAGPVRTCVGCRKTDAATRLLRVVAREVGPAIIVKPDPHHRLNGRGAWVHRDANCVGTAIKRRAFVRALRVSGQLDTTELERTLLPE